MDQETLRVVDDALRTYPLAPAPPTLVPQVRARLHMLAPAPRFRLYWLDYALSLFAAGMVALVSWVWQAITPLMAQELRIEVLLWTQRAGPIGLAAVLSGLTLAVGALGLAAVILTRGTHSGWKIGRGA